MNHSILRTSIALALGGIATSAVAEPTRVTVTFENLAPANGTFQSPHWIGFHDGSFDLYDGGTPANSLPIPGSTAIERLAEDGDNSQVAADFRRLQPNGVGATIPGPNGPLAPGEIASQTFTLDSTSPANRFFSYASMVLPSNDFWYANANPQAIPVFDEHGRFVAKDFIVGQNRVRDAGTEVNDELPENTAFFGQSVPDSGTPENGVIRSFGDASGVVAFRSPEDGGNVLADPRFAMADFTLAGYPLVKISFALAGDEPAAPFEPFRAFAKITGDQEVPAVHTRAAGVGGYTVLEDRVTFTNVFRKLNGLILAHLHLGAAGENGPVIANLLPANFDANDRRRTRLLERVISSSIQADDLVGPLAGQSIPDLAAAIREGRVYVNIHTSANPAGEIRGQLGTRR